jgi:hypothetical protein
MGRNIDINRQTVAEARYVNVKGEIGRDRIRNENIMENL